MFCFPIKLVDAAVSQGSLGRADKDTMREVPARQTRQIKRAAAKMPLQSS